MLSPPDSETALKANLLRLGSHWYFCVESSARRSGLLDAFHKMYPREAKGPPPQPSKLAHHIALFGLALLLPTQPQWVATNSVGGCHGDGTPLT